MGQPPPFSSQGRRLQNRACRPDGASVTEEQHLYSLNDEGWISCMRHYVDAAKQIKASGLG
jgi:hypothetical protein